jgi:hypothetical protein
MHYSHGALRYMEYEDDYHDILYKDWNHLDVSSLCCISHIRMSGWQFFPGKRFRQTDQIVNFPFTKPAKEI